MEFQVSLGSKRLRYIIFLLSTFWTNILWHISFTDESHWFPYSAQRNFSKPCVISSWIRKLLTNRWKDEWIRLSLAKFNFQNATFPYLTIFSQLARVYNHIRSKKLFYIVHEQKITYLISRIGWLEWQTKTHWLKIQDQFSLNYFNLANCITRNKLS